MGDSKRVSRWLAILGAAMVACPAVALADPSTPATATAPVFSNAAVSGGGFISVLAAAPSGTLIAGGDTQGFFRSVDGGVTWTPQDSSLPMTAYNVAALLPLNTAWYAAVGGGGSGGVARSTDDGQTWTAATHTKSSGSPPTFDGGNLPGETGHPRATGNLLASDGSYLYAASFGHGLERWSLQSASLGAGWQCVALCTSFFNSLALDGHGDAYVSVIAKTGQSKGVYEVLGLAPGARTKAISSRKGVSTGVQEMIVLGSRLYVAGASGIGYWSAGTWFSLDPSPHWYTLTGYETVPGSAPVDVLYAATDAGRGVNDVERLAVAGTSVGITGLVPNGSVGSTIYGTSIPWWEATQAGTAGQDTGPESMIGGCPSSSSTLCAATTLDDYVGSSILMRSRSGSGPDALLVAGRSGVWNYAPSSSPEWLPAVQGLDATFDLGIAVDPANSANVAAADSDWSVLASTDDFRTVDDAVLPPLFTPSSGSAYALTWDTSVSPSALIVAGGSQATNALGSLWYDAAWATGEPFSSMPLPAGVSTRPIALTVNATGQGTYVLVAAFQNAGVYAFTGSATVGSWTMIPAGPGGAPSVSPKDPHGVSLTWAVDGSALFMYDTGTHGLWSSAWDGSSFASWVGVYADRTATPGRGWTVADPSSPSVVWVSNTNGLGFIDTALCSTGCTPNWVTSAMGGPLAASRSASGDRVDMAGAGASPSFTEVQVTGCAIACPAVAGFADPYYADVARNPAALAAGSDGTVYVATLGNGIAVASAP